MISKVKNFLYKIEKENIRKRKTPKRFLGYAPNKKFDIRSISDFEHFIECEISPFICPMKWEDLEIDFNDKNKRFCTYCNKYVYKADNITMLNNLKNENKCVALSKYTLEKLNSKVDENYYINLENRLKISMLFMIFKKLESILWQTLKKENLSFYELFKQILIYIKNNDIADIYIEKNVDMKFLFKLYDKEINK